MLFYLLYLVLQQHTPLHTTDFYVARIEKVHNEYDVPAMEESRALLIFNSLEEACRKFGVPLEIGLALCKTESDFQNMRGKYGEYGYTQLKRKTAIWTAEYWNLPKIRKLVSTDPEILIYSPRINIFLGIAFLKYNLLRYKDYKQAIISYNKYSDGQSNDGERYFQRFVESLQYFIGGNEGE